MSDGHVSSAVAEPQAAAGRARILGDSDHLILLRLGDGVAATGAVAGALLIWSLAQTAPFNPAYVAEHAVWFVLVVPWMLLLLPAHRPAAMFLPADDHRHRGARRGHRRHALLRGFLPGPAGTACRGSWSCTS